MARQPTVEEVRRWADEVAAVDVLLSHKEQELLEV